MNENPNPEQHEHEWVLMPKIMPGDFMFADYEGHIWKCQCGATIWKKQGDLTPPTGKDLETIQYFIA